MTSHRFMLNNQNKREAQKIALLYNLFLPNYFGSNKNY